MLKRGLIAVSTLVFAISLAGCGEREQVKEDTEETVSTTVEKPVGDGGTTKTTEERKTETNTTVPADSSSTSTTTTETPAATTPDAAKPVEPVAPASAPAPSAPTEHTN